MHQANLLIGDESWGLTMLPYDTRGTDPDVIVCSYLRMGVADARTLVEQAILRPVASDCRVFIVSAKTILPDAQNALLKLFEEPNAHSIFFLIIPSEDLLLPTLRSRLFAYAQKDLETTHPDFDAWKKLGYTGRIDEVARRLKAEEKEWVSNIYRGFEAYAHLEKKESLLRDALMISMYKDAPGSSHKMLLEYLALTL